MATIETGKIDLLKQLSDQSDAIIKHSDAKNPEKTWMYRVTQGFWNEVYQARETGKPIILCSPNVPQEMIYALGAVPLPVDSLPTRLASSERAFRYIDISEQYVPNTVCTINKVNFGAVFSGDLGFVPAAMVYCSLPCDSSRSTYPAMADYLNRTYGVPVFVVDTPYRKDETGFKYIAGNLKRAYQFLLNVLHKEHDPDVLAHYLKNSNRVEELMCLIGDMRKAVPCPQGGRLLTLNGMVTCCMGSQYMLDYVEKQYVETKKLYDAKKSVLKSGVERYRVLWMQNMMWNYGSVMDWMEREFDACSVLNGFPFLGRDQIEDVYDDEQIWMCLARRCMGSPMVHSVCGPGEAYTKGIEHIMQDFTIDVGIFAGHVGCKHAWAAGRMVTDIVEKKYGVPVLTYDLDAGDIRYKSEQEVKDTIYDFFDTLAARGYEPGLERMKNLR